MSPTVVSSGRELAVAHPAPDPREETAPSRHLEVAPDSVARRRRRRRVLVASALVSTCSLFVLVAFHVLAVQYAFDIDRLAEARALEERRYERLRVEVATRSSPEAVVQAAQALGMVPASGVEQIEAPLAAPRATAPDETADTLADSWNTAKESLGP